MPAAGEEEMIARDIDLVRQTGGPLHIAHISTAGAVELVRRAQKEGLPVTCEVLTHHFAITDEEVERQGTSAKMSPPLRSAEDVAAMIAGLADNTIDTIATDHAPHTAAEKQLPFEEAPMGIVGLETAVGLTLTPPRPHRCTRPARRHREMDEMARSHPPPSRRPTQTR